MLVFALLPKIGWNSGSKFVSKTGCWATTVESKSVFLAILVFTNSGFVIGCKEFVLVERRFVVEMVLAALRNGLVACDAFGAFLLLIDVVVLYLERSEMMLPPLVLNLTGIGILLP